MANQKRSMFGLSLLGNSARQQRPNQFAGPLDLSGQQDMAQSDNLQQYGDILEQKLASRDRLLGGLDEFGEGRRAAINQDHADALNNSLTGLQNRGWLGSGLEPSMRQGMERQRQLSVGDLEDRLIQYRTGLESQLEQDLTAFQERLNFRGPDQNTALLLGQLLGGLG